MNYYVMPGSPMFKYKLFKKFKNIKKNLKYF